MEDKNNEILFKLRLEVVCMSYVLEIVSDSLMELHNSEEMINMAGATSWILNQVVDHLKFAVKEGS